MANSDLSFYATLTPGPIFEEWFPVDLENKIRTTLDAAFPVTPFDSNSIEEPWDLDQIQTGDLLIVIGKPGVLFMDGLTRRGTGSKITGVGIFIQSAEGLTVFGVPDLDSRFYHFPEYQEPLNLIQPFSRWTQEVGGDIYVRPMGFDSAIQASILTLAPAIVPVAPATVPIFYTAKVVAEVFSQLGLISSELVPEVVPGHFFKDLPLIESPTTLHLIQPYVPPVREVKFWKVEALHDAALVCRDALIGLGLSSEIFGIGSEEAPKLLVTPTTQNPNANELTVAIKNILKAVRWVNFDYEVVFN